MRSGLWEEQEEEEQEGVSARDGELWGEGPAGEQRQAEAEEWGGQRGGPAALPKLPLSGAGSSAAIAAGAEEEGQQGFHLGLTWARQALHAAGDTPRIGGA